MIPSCHIPAYGPDRQLMAFQFRAQVLSVKDDKLIWKMLSFQAVKGHKRRPEGFIDSFIVSAFRRIIDRFQSLPFLVGQDIADRPGVFRARSIADRLRFLAFRCLYCRLGRCQTAGRIESAGGSCPGHDTDGSGDRHSLDADRFAKQRKARFSCCRSRGGSHGACACGTSRRT